MIKKRPADGFPVSDVPGQILHGGICDSIAKTPADQRLWFLAHSWLFVGIDWNADHYSEADTSCKDQESDAWSGQQKHVKAGRSDRNSSVPIISTISSKPLI